MLGKLLSRIINCCNKETTHCTINGKTITIEGNHHDVSIINGIVYVDGQPYKDGDSENPEVVRAYKAVKVVVNGDVDNVDGTTIEVNGNVSGDIDGTTVRVTGNVGGDIDGTTVTVGGSVKGDIEAYTVRG